MRHNHDVTDRPVTELDDDTLAAMAKSGADAAFDVLVRRHQRVLLRVATKYLGDVDLAKDACQSAFLNLHRSLPRYEPRGRLRALLLRITLNECAMLSRRRNRDSRMLDELTVLPTPRAVTTDSETTALTREAQTEVDKALMGLSDKLRDAVILRFAGDLRCEDIGEALGVPLGTVKSRLFLALKQLRLHLKESHL